MQYKENSRLKEIDILCNKFDYLHHKIAINQNLSDSNYRILRAILVLGEGCTQTNIYKNICINKQTVNSSIKQLAENEIIYFENGKGRENKIYLTDKGKNIINDKIIPIEKIENEIVNEFTLEEYEMFVNITKKYINSFEQKIKPLINLKEGK